MADRAKGDGIMPNRNYQSGRRLEYKLMKDELKRGADIVIRSARSHSPIDVISIFKDWNRIYLWQVKGDKKGFSKVEAKRLKTKYRWMNNTMQVFFMIKERD